MSHGIRFLGNLEDNGSYKTTLSTTLKHIQAPALASQATLQTSSNMNTLVVVVLSLMILCADSASVASGRHRRGFFGEEDLLDSGLGGLGDLGGLQGLGGLKGLGGLGLGDVLGDYDGFNGDLTDGLLGGLL